MQTFLAITGANGTDVVLSGEVPISVALDISTSVTFKNSEEEGINRDVEEKRVKAMAIAYNKRLEQGGPLENGSLTLAATSEDAICIENTDIKGVVRVTINSPLPIMDRQHNAASFREAVFNNPEKLSSLRDYALNPLNTISFRIVLCSIDDARLRTLDMNRKSKNWTPLEILFSNLKEVERKEREGSIIDPIDKGKAVTYMFCRSASKDPNHPLFDLLTVDFTGQKIPPKLKRTALKKFIDTLSMFYEFLIKHYDGFKEMSIVQQSEIMKSLSLPYYQKLKNFHPNALNSSKFHNYGLFRQGAPMISECFNSMLRVWDYYRKNTTTITVLSQIKRKTIEEYCEEVIPLLLDTAPDSAAIKDEDWWRGTESYFSVKLKGDGEASTLKHIWKGIKPKGVGGEDWESFITVLQHKYEKKSYNATEREIRRISTAN